MSDDRANYPFSTLCVFDNFRGIKTITTIFLFLACMLYLKADILVNGNFSNGRANWKGDAKASDNLEHPSSSAPSGGVIIQLKADKWTKIYQTFTTREKRLRYSITFKLSSDYKPDLDQPDLSGSSLVPGLDDIDGVPVNGISGNGSWLGIIALTGVSYSSFSLEPDIQKADLQTLSGTVAGSPNLDNVDMVIVFVLPPGKGSVTITSISLIADRPSP